MGKLLRDTKLFSLLIDLKSYEFNPQKVEDINVTPCQLFHRARVIENMSSTYSPRVQQTIDDILFELTLLKDLAYKVYMWNNIWEDNFNYYYSEQIEIPEFAYARQVTKIKEKINRWIWNLYWWKFRSKKDFEKIMHIIEKYKLKYTRAKRLFYLEKQLKQNEFKKVIKVFKGLISNEKYDALMQLYNQVRHLQKMASENQRYKVLYSKKRKELKQKLKEVYEGVLNA